MTLTELAERLESYGFRNEAGPLEMCQEWQEMKREAALQELSGQTQEMEAEARGYARGVEDAAKVADGWGASVLTGETFDSDEVNMMMATIGPNVAFAIRALAKSTDGRGGSA